MGYWITSRALGSNCGLCIDPHRHWWQSNAPTNIECLKTSQDLMNMPSLTDVLRFLERRARGIVNLNENGKQ